MFALFDIDNIAFTCLNYPLSYVELLGTIFGFFGVYFASRSNILTWPIGIINEVFFFALFFQYQLYADMFLQVYFFAISLYGWYNWKFVKQPEEDFTLLLSLPKKIIIMLGIILVTFPIGYCIANLHEYLPNIFKEAAKMPYINSFILVASMVANTLLARRFIESWYLWLIVDTVAIALYFSQGIYFLTIEYLLFWLLALYAVFKWKNQDKNPA